MLCVWRVREIYFQTIERLQRETSRSCVSGFVHYSQWCWYKSQYILDKYITWHYLIDVSFWNCSALSKMSLLQIFGQFRVYRVFLLNCKDIMMDHMRVLWGILTLQRYYGHISVIQHRASSAFGRNHNSCHVSSFFISNSGNVIFLYCRTFLVRVDSGVYKVQDFNTRDQT